MQSTVNLYLEGIEFDNPQVSEDIFLFPILSKLDSGPDYICLQEALDLGVIVISEIGEGGSVPELKAVNKGKQPILIVDGEELIGAKQNRVVNTTIMLAPETTTIIPVSCVEAGRWSYSKDSKIFSKSENVMPESARKEKIKQVDASLKRNSQYKACQSEIWDDVERDLNYLRIASSTAAMAEIFEKKEKDLNDYLKDFSIVPEQKGILVFFNGKPVGLEFISKDIVFKKMYNKILKSYVIEALKEKEIQKYRMSNKETKEIEKNKEEKIIPTIEHAKDFINKAKKCKEAIYDSIGMGKSYRYHGEKIVGAALGVDDSVPHMVFLTDENDDDTNYYDRNFQRRRFTDYY